MINRKEEIESWFRQLQEDICTSLETLDGKSSFHEDLWTRPAGGGGRSRIMTNGALIEKGGVNFSAVHGLLPEKVQEALKLGKSHFYATGVSIVLHPQNPWVPIIHMNVRYFETTPEDPASGNTYWFGGGIDLTPHYVSREDGVFLHKTLRSVCDAADPAYYARFKKWADDYFFLKHRNETRGVGGIFYDHLNEHSENKSFPELWEFHQHVGRAFIPIYTHYAQKNRERTYTNENKQWQMIRRGRYVEFNLVWDKGTKFGLDTNGRTESILMSMPPHAEWLYDHLPKEGSPEAETLNWLKKDINWLEHA